MSSHTESTSTDIAPEETLLEKRTAALVLLCGIQLLLLLDFSIVNVALPRIQQALGFTYASIQWIVIAYALGFGGLLLFGGRLSDLLGRRAVLMSGLAAFGAASLLGGMTSSRGVLVAMRAIQGVGAAFIAPAVLSLITTGFPKGRERDLALGWFSAASASGFALGALLGGLITQFMGWRAVFFVNVPLVAIAVVAGFRLLPARPQKTAHGGYDFTGAVLSSLGCVSIIFGVSVIPTLGIKSAGTLVPLAVGLILLITFILVEARTSSPLVPLQIFQNRTLTIANVVCFTVPGIMGFNALILSIFLQQMQHKPAFTTGLSFLPLGLSALVAGPMAAMLSETIGTKRVLLIGTVLVAFGALVLSRITPASSYSTLILPGILLAGFGSAAFFAAVTIAGTSGAPDDEQGLASGLLNTSQQIGTALVIAVLMNVANASAHTSTGEIASRLAMGYGYAFQAAAWISLLATLIIAIGMPGSTRQSKAAKQ